MGGSQTATARKNDKQKLGHNVEGEEGEDVPGRPNLYEGRECLLVSWASRGQTLRYDYRRKRERKRSNGLQSRLSELIGVDCDWRVRVNCHIHGTTHLRRWLVTIARLLHGSRYTPWVGSIARTLVPHGQLMPWPITSFILHLTGTSLIRTYQGRLRESPQVVPRGTPRPGTDCGV